MKAGRTKLIQRASKRTFSEPAPRASARIVWHALLPVLIGLLAFQSGRANGATLVVHASRSEAIEAAGGELEKLVVAKDALGYYWDDVTEEYVVVVPATGESTFNSADTEGLAAKVRIETRNITRSVLDGIGASLERLQSSTESLAFGFYFDAQSGKVILQSEADIDAFKSVFGEFAGVIDFHPGKFELTSWSSPSEPYNGGSYLGGSQDCTSGVTVKNAGGTRFMITAGHCYAHDSVTTMGTAVRLSGQWPAYDLEYIKGKTYSAGIYDSPNTSRPVTTAANPSIGSNYCTTGRRTGFVCTWIVRSLNVTICYPSGYPGCAHGLAGFLPPTDQGTQYLLGGDSGGPLWFKYANGSAGIRGINSGVFFDLATGRVFSYATMYNYIPSQMGLNAVILPVP